MLLRVDEEVYNQFSHKRSVVVYSCNGSLGSSCVFAVKYSITGTSVTWISRLKVVCLTCVCVCVCVHCRYNNQWMIVDYNHFIPGKTDIKEELFVVLEQIP